MSQTLRRVRTVYQRTAPATRTMAATDRPPNSRSVPVWFGVLALVAALAGRVRMEGKDYVMADGDVVEFRFNV